METSETKQIVEWAKQAKVHALVADLETVPRDEIILRAAVAYQMLTREPFPAMCAVSDSVTTEDESRASAIVMMALNFDDAPPRPSHRAALLAVKLDEVRQ